MATTGDSVLDKSVKSARLRNSKVVFLVGDLAASAKWYEGIGFQSRLFPPGFGILLRDYVEIFLQATDGYVRPNDPAAHEREAWNVYIETDDVKALYEEFSRRPEINILRGLETQQYG